MKLKIRDMEAENDKVAEKDYLDLFEVGADPGDEDNNPLYMWVRPAHLDDNEGNPDPRIARAATEHGINVRRVIVEEVSSSSKSTEGSEHSMDTLEREMRATHHSLTTIEEERLARQQEEDKDDDDDDDSGDGSDGGDEGAGPSTYHGEYSQETEQPGVTPFTGESQYTHATHDEDHGSRAGGEGIGAIGKTYTRRRQAGYESYESYDNDSLSSNMERMSLSTDYGYQPNYDSYNSDYNSDYSGVGAYNYGQPYPYHSTSSTTEYSQGPQYASWVDDRFPPIGVVGVDYESYVSHVQNFLASFEGRVSWAQYCYDQTSYSNSGLQAPRRSFWY